MTVLDDILDGVRTDLADRQSRLPEHELGVQAASAPAPLDPLPAFAAVGASLIAEVNTAVADVTAGRVVKPVLVW